MEVHAADESMPVACGWHPWWSRNAGRGEPLTVDLDADAMYARDEDGIPTGELVPIGAHPWDDCFTNLGDRPAVLRWPARSASPSRRPAGASSCSTSRSTPSASSPNPTRPTRSISAPPSSARASRSSPRRPGRGSWRTGRRRLMPTALSDDDVAAIDAYWRAANYLTVGQIYLSDNALLREAAAARAHQAASARALGHLTRPEPPVRAPEPRDPRPRRRRHLHHRPRSRWPRHPRQRVPRGHVQRDVSGGDARRRRFAPAVPPVLDPGRGCRAT